MRRLAPWSRLCRWWVAEPTVAIDGYRPEAWEAPTACEGWSTRDIAAHIVDTTEGYFRALDAARGTGEVPAPYGLVVMGKKVNEAATALRGVPQAEMMDRLRNDFYKMQELLDPIGPDDWTGFIVTHPYMGPVPACFYAAGQLMDNGVHSWDIRQTSGRTRSTRQGVHRLPEPGRPERRQPIGRPCLDGPEVEAAARPGRRVGRRRRQDVRRSARSRSLSRAR